MVYGTLWPCVFSKHVPHATRRKEMYGYITVTVAPHWGTTLLDVRFSKGRGQDVFNVIFS